MDEASRPPVAAAAKKTKKKKTKKKATMQHQHQLCIRSRARALCRVMELRTSVARYYMEDSQYMDRVRSRVAISLGAFDESDEWKYGRKVLNTLDSFLPTKETPEELSNDLDLLGDLEAQLETGTSRPDTDIPDDDLNELSECLREEIDVLRDKVDKMRQSVASLQQRVNPTPPPPPLSAY